ncbi:cation diffusion facilitator family transporter [Fulvimarina sp. MAC8]|uniref:cation diffusion facilitator family transporter n=1 Tax=Fulvimarina sp. MAC8 TaxID=3162874 RepID=UPI0032EFE086
MSHHDHDHDHDHDHSDHSHSHGFKGHAHGANEKRIAISAVLTGVFMLAEVVGGLISGSLALLADAGHMLTDFAALALGWFAFRLSRKPGDRERTYGYDRFEVLVAFVNGLTLFAIAAFITYEAVHRLMTPGEVLGGTMLAVAIAGLVVNIVVFFVLHGADRDNLNIRGAVLHVLGDLLGSVAAIVAAGIIIWTGWTPIDPILSVLVSAIILVSAYRLVRDAGHVLLEGAPQDIDVKTLKSRLISEVNGLKDVHHVHIWSLTPERPMATLHACIDEAADGPEITRTIKAELKQRFSIEHATVEVEYGSCADDAVHHAEHRHGSHDHHHAEADEVSPAHQPA